ncbi:MAG: hypothetical protein WD844_00405 [Thermoleophilaceae bacterium]
MTERRTFVLRMQESGTVLVENLRSGECARVDDLSGVADKLKDWLADEYGDGDRHAMPEQD